MELYRIETSTWEDSRDAILVHDTPFLDEELIEMVLAVLPEAVKQERATDFSYIHRFNDVFDQVISLLCSQYGFRKVKYSAQITIPGNESIFVRDERISAHNEELPLEKRIRETLQAAGFTRRDDPFLSFLHKQQPSG